MSESLKYPVTSRRYENKVALITGAASGIGRAVSVRLALEGAKVYAVDIAEAGLASLKDEIASNDGMVSTSVASVATAAECHDIVQHCVDEFGQLDVLGNVAGVLWANHFRDVAETSYRQMMAVNVDGPFFLSQAALPYLQDVNGNIVNIASNAGLMGTAYNVAYSMTKGAIVQMTRSLAMELAKSRVRVNAIAPGGIDTGLTQTIQIPGDIDPDLLLRYSGYRGMGHPDDIAVLFALVASNEGRNMHGAILSSDLGLTTG